MNTLALHPDYKPHDPSRRMVGIGVVVVLHLLLAYALVTGTARTAFEMVKKPLQAVLIEDIIIPPPPPPPPPPKEIAKPQEAPKIDAPPPPFVPPPDAPPPATITAPTIQSVATPPPAPVVIAPPPPPAPVVAPPTPSGPVRADIKLACPTQVAPDMPRKALQDGTVGVVRAQALVRNGAVVEVTILSGPKVFHQAVRTAMLQYKCQSNPGDVLAAQEFDFKIAE
jgi:protein TonB